MNKKFLLCFFCIVLLSYRCEISNNTKKTENLKVVPLDFQDNELKPKNQDSTINNKDTITTPDIYLRKTIFNKLQREDILELLAKANTAGEGGIEIRKYLVNKLIGNFNGIFRCKCPLMREEKLSILQGECYSFSKTAKNTYLFTYNKDSVIIIDELSFKSRETSNNVNYNYSYLGYSGDNTFVVYILGPTKSDGPPTPETARKKDIWSITKEGKFKLIRSEHLRK